jgi:hypothetical protein
MSKKYKIIKVAGMTPSTDRYFAYRKGLFFWKLLKSEWTQKEAEEVIAQDKKIIQHRKAKPEVIGYY